MLARLTHTHHARHLEDLPFWLELARQSGDPILELGCGSGRVLLPLARAGHKVVGLERDSGMLSILREDKEPGLQGLVSLVQGDMAAFGLGVRFPLILLPCNTFSALSTDQRRATLDCVRRHLRPQGLFATSLPNPALLQRMPRHAEPEVEESFPHPLDGEPVQVSSGWERTSTDYTVHWYYDHLLPDGHVERFTTQVSHGLVSTEAYMAAMEAAGLHLMERYGDFDRSPYALQSPSLILVAGLRF